MRGAREGRWIKLAAAKYRYRPPGELLITSSWIVLAPKAALIKPVLRASVRSIGGVLATLPVRVDGSEYRRVVLCG